MGRVVVVKQYTPGLKRRYILIVSLLSLLLVAAQSGHVVSLTASGGGGFNETITISATVQADDGTNNTNLYFEIRAPDGTVVATNGTNVPDLGAGQTFSYSWASNNGSYPAMGDYSVSACWSTGGSHNCNIASATSTFYSASTLGIWFWAALVMVCAWLWRVRKPLFGPVKSAV